jgi:hypothetical protein
MESMVEYIPIFFLQMGAVIGSVYLNVFMTRWIPVFVGMTIKDGASRRTLQKLLDMDTGIKKHVMARE